MEITTRLKRLEHGFAASHVRQETKLELTVIRNDENVTRRRRECSADTVTVLFKCGLVLKTRTPRRVDQSRC